MAAPLQTWTLEYAGTSKSLANWGVSAAALEYRSQAADTLQLQCAGLLSDMAPLFDYLGEVILRKPASEGEGTIVFRGRRIQPDVSESGTAASHVYLFAGPWDFFEKTTFHQRWKDYGTTPPSYRYTTHALVPLRLDSNNVSENITTGQMIGEVVSFIRDQHGAVMQAGTLTPALYLPVDEKLDQRCSEIIRLMLGLTPDAVTSFDYSTTPPTFHVLQRANLTAISIALTSERLNAVRLQRRDDLVPSAVVINFERTDVIDGLVRPIFVQQSAPPSATGREYGALTQTIRLWGAEVVKVRGSVETLPVPASPDADWFVARGLVLDTDMVLTNFEFVSRDGDLPYEITGGQVQSWMEDPDGNEAEMEGDTVECQFTKSITGRFTANKKTAKVKINTTNIPGGDYEKVASAVAAEAIPAGMASTIYNSLSTVHYQGSITLTEAEAQVDVSLRNVINLPGGTGRFAAINAIVQGVSYDLTSGTTHISVGPPAHLGIPDLIELMRFNRARRSYTDPSVQSSGTMGAADVQVDGLGPVASVEEGDGKPQEMTLKEEIPTGASVPINAGQISLVPADTLGKEVRARQVAVTVRNSSGQCVTRYRVIVCSDLYDLP